MRRLFILSAAVAALASCSNSEVITEVNEPQVPDKAIAFETFSSNATRDGAENSGATTAEGLEKHHSNFSVWGYKDVQDTYVFGTASDSEGKSSTGVTVTAVENPVSSGTYIWTYSPIRFWDKSANSYEFYACAPATTSGTDPYFVLNQKTDAKSDDYFTLSDVQLDNYTLSSIAYQHSMKTGQVQNSGNATGGNIDYMIASPCQIAKSSIGQPVQLHFNHILSRLNVTVHKSSELSGFNVSLNSLEVCNLMSKGSFNENSVNTNLSNGTTERWSNTSDPITYVGNAITTGDLVGKSTNPKYVLQSLVIPQKIAFQAVERSGKVKYSSSGTEQERELTLNDAPYIKLKYTISVENGYTESFEAYFNLAAAFGATDTTTDVCFNEGWQNTLNIIIDASKISFSADVYWWDNKEKNLNTETGHVPSTGGN